MVDLADTDEPALFVGVRGKRISPRTVQTQLRKRAIEQGADPRDAWLVAFGGAGGLHATALARSLGMAGVIVPPHGGVLSAVGLLLSPPRVDTARSVLLRDEDSLDDTVAAIAAEALEQLPDAAVEMSGRLGQRTARRSAGPNSTIRCPVHFIPARAPVRW